MRLSCTAPCFPRCHEQAAAVLLNAKSGSELGLNCETHLKPLIKARDSDYDRAPLPEFQPATYPKLSSDEYEFEFLIRTGVYITLRQVSSGKVKEFYLAGRGASQLPALENHMNSLTDDLCSQWFNVREKKGKTAKKEQ